MTKQEISLNRFTETGPIARGEIYADEHSFLLNKNSRIAAPCVKVKLLVDTGANISGIDWRIISALNLNRYDENLEVNGVGGTHSLNRFRCVLFLNIFGFKGLPIDVVEGNFNGSPYDGIIGRDVLQFCSFRYHGPTNTFELQALDF